MADLTPPPDALAVLIPCYNCGRSVRAVVAGCRPYASLILTVNDGSQDDTAECLNECGTEILGWPDNRGKGAALIAGFEHLLAQAGWSLVATLDSDGQHDPADLPRLLGRFRETRADLVIGRRDFDLPAGPARRRWANKYSSKLIGWLTGCRIRDIQSGFRLYTRSALERLLPRVSSTHFALETEMVILAHKSGMRIEEVDIRCIYTPESSVRSSWRPVVDSWRIARVVGRCLFTRREQPPSA
ncbi:MAG: glycosyltransferase family 2 protein [bacterium]